MTQKNRHLHTIAQFVGLNLRNYRMYRQTEKNFLKQQYLLHMSPQYGELRPTSG